MACRKDGPEARGPEHFPRRPGGHSEWATEWVSSLGRGSTAGQKRDPLQLITGCPYARGNRFLVVPQRDRRVSVPQLGLRALRVFGAVAEQCGASSPQTAEVDIGFED